VTEPLQGRSKNFRTIYGHPRMYRNWAAPPPPPPVSPPPQGSRSPCVCLHILEALTPTKTYQNYLRIIWVRHIYTKKTVGSGRDDCPLKPPKADPVAGPLLKHIGRQRQNDIGKIATPSPSPGCTRQKGRKMGVLSEKRIARCRSWERVRACWPAPPPPPQPRQVFARLKTAN
jgi:hypothetical protein